MNSVICASQPKALEVFESVVLEDVYHLNWAPRNIGAYALSNSAFVVNMLDLQGDMKLHVDSASTIQELRTSRFGAVNASKVEY